MTAPSYVTDLADIITDPTSSSGWTLISSGGGGANSLTVPETDDYIQSATPGTYGSISRNPFSSSIRGMVYNSSQTVGSGNAVFVWTKSDVAQALASKASGGIQVLIGNTSGDLKCWYVSGNDDAFGGWKCFPVDPTITPSTTVGSPTSTTAYFGVRWNVPASGPSKGYPFKIDAIRRGRKVTVTFGESGDYATFAGLSSYASALARRWGQFFLKDGSYFFQGFLLLGVDGGDLVNFIDSNRVIYIQNTEFVSSAFNRIEIQNSSSVVNWTNIAISALGTVSPGTFVVTAGALTAESCQFIGMGAFTFLSSSSVKNTSFRGCGVVTAPGSDLRGSKIISPTVATAGSALVWNSATALDGKVDNMTFQMGSNNHHAIEIGTSASTSQTIRGCTFAGFSGSDGADGSVLYLRDQGSDKTWTIGCVGCTGTVTYKKERSTDTVNLTQGVALTISVVDSDTGSPINGARVLAKAASGGPNPYQASVGLTRLGSTVTVDHSTHGLKTGDYVVIEGAVEGDYNGVWQITYSDANTYTFDIGAKTPTSPATGSPVSTLAIISATTSGGAVSDTRTYSSDQPFSGRVRYAAGPYKTSPFSGTISSSSGASATVQMVKDE